MVNDILHQSISIANDVYKPFSDIRNNRDKLREKMLEQGIIQNLSPAGEDTIPSCCGLDGYATVVRLLSSNLTCSAAFAVEGLAPPSGERHWANPAHRTAFHTEKQFPQAPLIAEAIKMEMITELAAGAPHEIVFSNHSFVSAFTVIMETLKTAFETKDNNSSRDFLTRLKPAIVAFKEITSDTDARKMRVGIPQNPASRELAGRLQLPPQFDDTILFTVILEPGEYTKPVQIDQTNLTKVKNIPISDEIFSSVRDSLAAVLSRLMVTYYRPKEHAPTVRVEVGPGIARDDTKLGTIFRTLSFQYKTSGIPKPFPAFGAGSLARDFKRAIPALRKLTTTKLTNLHTGTLGDLIPLLTLHD